MSENDMDIRIVNIQKSFGRKTVLKDVSFDMDLGSCAAIVGANGSGKSTLLSILAGVQRGNGSFFYAGEDLMKNPKKRGSLVGYVPQGAPLIQELSARDNLLLWFSPDRLKYESEHGVIKQFGVDEFLKVPVRKMSGGMKKRLSIVCAVANDPKIILMDEAAAALDLVCKQVIRDYIRSCKSQNKAIILSTHDERELALCDKVYLLKGGELSQFGYDGNIDKLVEHIK